MLSTKKIFTKLFRRSLFPLCGGIFIFQGKISFGVNGFHVRNYHHHHHRRVGHSSSHIQRCNFLRYTSIHRNLVFQGRTQHSCLYRFKSTTGTDTTTTTSLSSVKAGRLRGLDQPTVWHEFSPLAVQHKSVNLGQGFPDWNPPEFCFDAMDKSIRPEFGRNANQYARSYAHMPLANVLADVYTERFSTAAAGDSQASIDPATQVATATGVTNVLYCALQGLINPGDEVLMLEPYFDIYASQVQMAGGECVYCPLRPKRASDGDDDDGTATAADDYFQLDLEELDRQISDKTKVFIFNSPHNPTGKVFSKEEMEGIAKVLLKYPNLIVLSDEVYEHIVFDDAEHVHIATILPGMFEKTLTMSSAGKTFSCTGWKVGWAIGPAHLISAVTAVQQWVNFSPATPTQDAIAQALVVAKTQPYNGFDDYYSYLQNDYAEKRQALLMALRESRLPFQPLIPSGTFFIMVDTSEIDFDEDYERIATTQVTPAMPILPNPDVDNRSLTMPRDWALSRWLTQEVGVTAIPPSAFYSPPNTPLAANLLRFAFCKNIGTIQQAGDRLNTFKG